MTEGDYTYVLESAEDGEKHTCECKDGVYRADGCIEDDPIVQCLMDATLDLLLQQADMMARWENFHEGEGALNRDSFHMLLNHPGSGRSH
jgi:hypothetical protein